MRGSGDDDGDAEPDDLNMLSAFLHVFADSLRSFTTLIEALLIGVWDFDGRETDAGASLFVSATSAPVHRTCQTHFGSSTAMLNALLVASSLRCGDGLQRMASAVCQSTAPRKVTRNVQ